MSFLKTPEFKVGLLVVGIGAVVAFMSMQVSNDPSYLSRSKKAWFLLPNAAGLVKGSAIKAAGIPVGVIKNITLQDGQARVDITVRSDVVLTRSAAVAMKANGILGDKGIEVYPGTVGDPDLEDGGQILNVKGGGGMDDVMKEVSELASSLKEVAKNLKEATENDGTNRHILGRIVLNVEKLTGDIAQMTSENKGQIREIVDQIHSITGTVDELMRDESDNGFKKTWASTMERLNTTMKNVEEITTKINKGEGTIGKLISDEKTAEDVSTAIEGISGFVDSANKISTGIDFNSYYLGEVKGTKTTIGLYIQPGLDRFYYLGLVTDPAGVVEVTDYSNTSGGTTTNLTETKTFKSKNKITALFGKNFYDFTVRGGLIEDTGGLGFDYKLFDDRLMASVDAYDFKNFQLRASLNYKLFYGLYVMAGYNDIFDKKDANSYYLGAGLFLTNDDLKLLLSGSPF